MRHGKYITVPALRTERGDADDDTINNRCKGCVAERYLGRATTDLCGVLKAESPQNSEVWCLNVVWIEDTDEGKAAYTAARMGA